MALSGSFSGSIVSGNYALRVDWSATQSVANNTSKVTCTLYLVQKSSWSLYISSRDDNTASINGTSYTWKSPAISNNGGKTTKLATITSGNIAHNDDGTKSVSISATFYVRATISGSYREKITASATITLNTIPRATTPTLSASSAYMGDKVTINMDRASSKFTHNLVYFFAGVNAGTIATNAGTSHTWTIPESLAAKIPNATSGTVTIRCTTMNGSTVVGSKNVLLTVKVPTDVVPTISAVSVSEATDGLAEQFGAYIQNKSKLKVTITAAGASGSTIKSYQVGVAGQSSTSKSWTTGVITKSGNQTLTVKVTDSRGRTAKKALSIPVLAYSPPKVSEFNGYRADINGKAQDDGVCASLAFAYRVTALGNKNTASMKIQAKRHTDETYSTTVLTGTSLTNSGLYLVTDPTFSTDYQWDFRIQVTDWFGATAAYEFTLPTGKVILDLNASGEGLAIGKTSEQPGLEIGWDIVGRLFTAGTYSGRHRTHDGLLIQWGRVTITPTAADVATPVVLTYPLQYATPPAVLVSPVTSVPHNMSVSVMSGVDDLTKQIQVILTRSGTTSTGINWLAIGKGAE